jgi:hypothetical protein
MEAYQINDAISVHATADPSVSELPTCSPPPPRVMPVSVAAASPPALPSVRPPPLPAAVPAAVAPSADALAASRYLGLPEAAQAFATLRSPGLLPDGLAPFLQEAFGRVDDGSDSEDSDKDMAALSPEEAAAWNRAVAAEEEFADECGFGGGGWDSPMFCDSIREGLEDRNADGPYSKRGRTPAVLACLQAYGFLCEPDHEKPHQCFESKVRKVKGDMSKLPSIAQLAAKIRKEGDVAPYMDVPKDSTDAELVKCMLAINFDGWFWSFCFNGLQQATCTWHCRHCRQCVDWREWHCKGCGKCQYGVSIPCQTCQPTLYKMRMKADY